MSHYVRQPSPDGRIPGEVIKYKTKASRKMNTPEQQLRLEKAQEKMHDMWDKLLRGARK